MNHQYRVVWNSALHLWQAVAECASGVGKGRGHGARRLRRRAATALLAGTAAAAFAGPPAPLPTGGQVVAGQATITTQGSVLTVQQQTARVATDWTSFNIGSGSTVNFVQPSADAVALNRVVGGDPSRIEGSLKSNGQVFLLNPNGVLFAPGSQVDVGGLVASTLKLSTADFMAGRYNFAGDSTAAVVNQGRITVAPNGTVAMIAAHIVNTGRIEADGGQVLMGAGRKITLDLGGPVKLQVEEGALDALIEQGGAVRADGGLVYLTAKAAGELSHAVINHTGVTEARTLATGQTGEIVLLGDFDHGRVSVGGTLDASAPAGGHGGFIETSAKDVDFQAGRVVTTRSADGASGTWLIDPNDFTIGTVGGNISGAQLSADLAAGNVAISTATQGTAGGNGDINVNDPVSWASHTLTLNAGRNINVNASLTATGSAALAFQYGQLSTAGTGATWTVDSNAKILIPAATAFTWKKGSSGATNALVFNNGNIRFGNGTQASFTTDGQLMQPFYFDNTTAGRNGWYQLTFSNYPLDIAVGAGGNGASSWNYNGTVLSTNDASYTNTYSSALSNRSLDISGYHEGVGTVITSSTLSFGGGQTAKVENAYTLDSGKNFVKIDTQLTNTSAGGLTNVRIWTGTRDDFVGQSDQPRKTKGNITGSGFTALSSASDSSNALEITERTDGTGAGVLFYSTSAGADTVHDYCCYFSSVTNKNPRSSAITATNDGSYALYMRLADLSAGQSGGLTWYYAAAPVAQLGNAVTQVGQSAGVVTSTPIYLRLNSGSSVYGNSPSFSYSLFDASSGGNAVTDASPTGTASWTGAPTSTSSAGTYSITYASGIVLGNTAYTLNPGAAGSWTVAPRPLNLTVTKVYNGSATLGSGFALAGMVNGDAAPTVSGQATLAGANAGSYASLASSSLALSNGNYTLSGGSVAATITQRPITVTADAASKVYGNTDPALTYQVTGGSLVSGDSLSGALTRTAGENVGSYTINASALANGNYAITANNGTLTISPRPITVTADAAGKVYGNADPALTYQVTSGNLVGNDTLSGALTRAAGENVGSYTIDASALANGNYAVTANNGTLTISPRPITVTADAAGKVYGNADPALTYQVTSGNLVGNDTLSGALTRAAGENVGSYTIDASALANGNYAVTANNGTLTISQRPITITADTAGKVYGNADPALTYQVTSGNLVGSDTLSGVLTRNAGENVGSYTIDASALANGNYAVTANNGTLTISPRPITVTADAAGKVYGNADPALTYQVTSGNLVGSDTLSGVLTRAAGENVGSYTIDASALANGNYAVTANNGTLTISQRPITITADTAGKIYGNTDPSLTYRITSGSLVNGDSLSGTLARSAGSNAGTYMIDASALANGNYAITANNGTLTISPRPITVTADAASKVYGNSDPSLSYRVTGGSLVGSDTLSGALSRVAGENVGSYAIDAGALANGNYVITAENGTLTIAPSVNSLLVAGNTPSSTTVVSSVISSALPPTGTGDLLLVDTQEAPTRAAAPAQASNASGIGGRQRVYVVSGGIRLPGQTTVVTNETTDTASAP